MKRQVIAHHLQYDHTMLGTSCWRLGAIITHYFHYRTFVKGKLPHFFFFPNSYTITLLVTTFDR